MSCPPGSLHRRNGSRACQERDIARSRPEPKQTPRRKAIDGHELKVDSQLAIQGARKKGARQDEKQMAAKRAQEAQQSLSLLQSSLPDSDELDTQMFADFFDTYVPAHLSPWRQMTYLRAIAEKVPETALLKQAKRTMGLAHVGALSRNERIRLESRVAYGRLLGMLNFFLSLSGTCKTDRDNFRAILSTMALMTYVKDSVKQSPDDEEDDSWVVHLEAAQHLLVIRGPRNLSAQTTPDKGLIRHICHNSFLLAVAKRKAWIIPSTWLRIESSGMPELIQVFRTLPTILEQTDRALSSGDLVTELLDYTSRLHLMAHHAIGLFPDIEEPSRWGMPQIRRMRTNAPEKAVIMANPSVFPDLYAPMSEVSANRLGLTATLTLVAQCTILRIWYLCPETTMLVPNDFRRNIEQGVDRLARRLCKLVLSFLDMDRVVSAFIMRLCLQLAYNIFEQQSALAEMGWCHALLIANQTRLDHIRQENVSTLCKIGQTFSGIAEAGRYAADFDRRAFIVKSDKNTGRDTNQRNS